MLSEHGKHIETHEHDLMGQTFDSLIDVDCRMTQICMNKPPE